MRSYTSLVLGGWICGFMSMMAGTNAFMSDGEPEPVEVPLPSKEQMVCKKMYKDFLKCSLENDWDPYISGWNQDKECLDSGDLGFYEKFKENCPTTQVEFQNAEMINDIQSPGFITVMGQDLDTLYGLMLIPDHSTTKVYDIDCHVCSLFVKKILECLLPIKIETDMDEDIFKKMDECVGHKPKSLAMAAQCLDGAPWYPMEPDGDSGYVTFAHVSPVLKINRVFEVCYPADGSVVFDTITKEAFVEVVILPEKDKLGVSDPTQPETEVWEVEGDEPEIDLQEGDKYTEVY